MRDKEKFLAWVEVEVARICRDSERYMAEWRCGELEFERLLDAHERAL